MSHMKSHQRRNRKKEEKRLGMIKVVNYINISSILTHSQSTNYL